MTVKTRIVNVESIFSARQSNNLIGIAGDSISEAFSSCARIVCASLGIRQTNEIYAVGGYKINDVNTKIPAMVSDGIKYLLLQIGSNEVLSSNENIYSDFETLIKNLKNENITVLCSYIPPRDTSFSNKIFDINNIIYSVCKKYDVLVFDPWSQFSTGNGEWNASVISDGMSLHPTLSTHKTASAEFIRQINKNETKLPLIRSYKDGLVQGSCFEADTNSDGVADNWQAIDIIGTSHAFSRSLYRDGMYYQVVTVTNPVGNENTTLRQLVDLNPSKKYRFSCFLSSTSPDANQNLSYSSVVISYYKDGQYLSPYKTLYNSQSYNSNGDTEFMLDIDETENLCTGIAIRLTTTSVGAFTGVCVYKYRNIGLWEVVE